MSNDAKVLKVRALLGNYPNTRAARTGEIRPSGFEKDFLDEKTVNKAFKRVVGPLEFDIAELAIATYFQAKAAGKPLVLLPLVTRGKFAHSTGAYNVESGIKSPKDLEGRKVGIRAWAQTTPLWVRGILQNDYGVDLDKIKWSTFEDSHNLEFKDPPGVVRVGPDKKLRQMVLDRELDAGIMSEQRDSPDPRLKPVIPDPQAAAQEWYAKYKLVPINHMVVVKKSFLEAHPDVVREVFRVYAESRKAAGMPPAGGIDQFPIGVEPNRKSLELAIKYAVQQHLIPKAFTVDELFDDMTRRLGA